MPGMVFETGAFMALMALMAFMAFIGLVGGAGAADVAFVAFIAFIACGAAAALADGAAGPKAASSNCCTRRSCATFMAFGMAMNRNGSDLRKV